MDKALENAISAASHYGVTDAELAVVVEAATAAKRAVADPGDVAIVHPALHRQMLVDPDSVPVYEASGWQVKPDVPEVDDSNPPAEEAESTDVKPAAKPKTKEN